MELKLKCSYCNQECSDVTGGQKHEKICSYNPANKACQICKHLTGVYEKDEADKEMYVYICTRLKSSEEQKETQDYHIIKDVDKNNCDGESFELSSWREITKKPVKIAKQLKKIQKQLDDLAQEKVRQTKDTEMLMLGKLLYKLLGGK